MYLEDMAKIAPELVLTAVALIVLVADLLTKGKDSKRIGVITLAGLGLTGLLLIRQWGELGESGTTTAFAMVTLDQFGTFFKLFTVGSLAVVTLFVMADKRERKDQIGEYYFLLLGAAIGIFFMVSTNNLLLLMLGLELLSLSSYSLAGFHKHERRSGEAAMKYVIFGGLSAGIMLYGISLLYGLTGSIDLVEMASSATLAAQFDSSPVPVAVAVVLILAGFAYKVSVVPFHFWTPDVYEGAPTPVATFLAVASKAGGFAVMLRFIGELFRPVGVSEAIEAYGDRVGLLLALLAAVTMTVGNFSALRQASLKRMLAFSSVAHAGYVLMGIAVMTEEGFSAAMFYLAAYYFMNLGAFGFLLYFEGVTGSERIDSLKGMGFKAPIISIAMVIFLVSLTGLPPTVGFNGKVVLIQAVWGASFAPWLLVVLAVNTVVSLFYYFRVVKALFLAPEADETPSAQPAMAGFLAALALMTAYFGLFPDMLEGWAADGSSSLELVQSADPQ